MNSNTMNMGSTSTSALGTDVDRSVDQASTRAHDAVDRVSEKLDRIAPAVDRVAERAHQTIDSVAQRAAPAAQWAQSQARRVTTTTNEYADQWSSYVRERPLTSVGAALAIGYVLGRIMR